VFSGLLLQLSLLSSRLSSCSVSSPLVHRNSQLTSYPVSEISWPMSFFDRFFPVLGSQFGLGALGIFQGL
jgi:hypothetical protein